MFMLSPEIGFQLDFFITLKTYFYTKETGIEDDEKA